MSTRRFSRSRSFVGVLVCAGALAASACASHDRTPAVRSFESGRFAEARALFEAGLIDAPKDAALDHNAAGLAALAQGDLSGSQRHFSEAFHELEDLSSNTLETVGAMVGPERSKRWKGDPHERCMNAYYFGICYWLNGDVDNAAASFKSGILRDADSEEGAARSDFALLHLLSGLAERDARHEDRGIDSLRAAAGLLPGSPFSDPQATADVNLVIVVDRGRGPRRVPTGPEGAWVAFRGSHGRGSPAELFQNGTLIARATPAVDVQWQAMTRGDKVLDGVNKGKAVIKTGARLVGIHRLATAENNSDVAIGAGLFLASLLIPSEADLRTWETLPASVEVIAVKLPPGRHELMLQFPHSRGAPGVGPFEVNLSASRITLVWTRDLPGVGVRVQGRRDTLELPAGAAHGTLKSALRTGTGAGTEGGLR